MVEMILEIFVHLKMANFSGGKICPTTLSLDSQWL